MVAYGSNNRPVELDFFQEIVEVHWTTEGQLLVIWYDNGEKCGSPRTATKILSATKRVDGEDVAFTLPTDQVGERDWYPGNPAPDEWFYHATLQQGGLDVLEWGGIRDQWVSSEATFYNAFGEQQIVLHLDNIAEAAGTSNFKIEIECRWGVFAIGGDANPGSSRILAEIRDGEATWINGDTAINEQFSPQKSFELTGDVQDDAQLGGLTLPSVNGSSSNGDMRGAWAAVAAIVTYDCLDGSPSITVTAP